MHSRRQSVHFGRSSSHFLFRFLHEVHPVWVLVILTGFDETSIVSLAPFWLGSHSTCSREHLAHGISPLQACLIFEHRAHTTRAVLDIILVRAFARL